MRIGLITERIGAHLGGAERWAHDFAAWLIRQGHEVHVVCRADRRNAPPGGVTSHTIACGRSPLDFGGAAAPRVDALALDVSHDMGCGWNCTVLQPHCGSRAAAIQRNLQLVSPNLRTVVAAAQHHLPRYRRFAALCRRQYVNDGRRFLAISHMVARDIERYHNVDRGRIHVVHNGVDIETFTPAVRIGMRDAMRETLGVTGQDVLLLLVAHNLRLKGLPALIQSAAALRRAGAPVKLVVVGSRRTGRYARACRRARVDARFVGSVADPRPYYAAADMYVHPTVYDPCSLVVLEAWACGLPVVTTCFNGCAELMSGELSEYVLADPIDVEGLTSRLTKLLEPRLRARLGAQSRALAEAHPADRSFREILNVYRALFDCRSEAA